MARASRCSEGLVCPHHAQLLDRDLEEAEEQHSLAARSHLMVVERLLELQHSRMCALEAQFAADLQALQDEFDTWVAAGGGQRRCRAADASCPWLQAAGTANGQCFYSPGQQQCCARASIQVLAGHPPCDAGLAAALQPRQPRRAGD